MEKLEQIENSYELHNSSLNEILPTSQEISLLLLDDLKHSQSVIYYQEACEVKDDDPQKPHDLEGKGSKLDWQVICGRAIQNRDNSSEFFYIKVKPSIAYHQEHQRHHQRWNSPNGDTTYEDLEAEAIDAIRAQTENSIFRKYRGEPVCLKNLPKILDRFTNPLHKTFVSFMYNRMIKFPEPKTDLITNVYDFPNIGISDEMYQRTQARIKEALQDLRNRGYDL